jgi:hypothetical protein
MRVFKRGVMVFGIVMLSATMAQAGGGQGGGTDVAGFQCYLINGVNQRQVLNTADTTDPTGLSFHFPAREHVAVGAGRLVCAPVIVSVPKHEPPFPPLDNTDSYPLAEHLKCYDAFDPRLILTRGPKVTTWDALDVEDLRVGAPVFICIPSAVTPPRP